MGGLLFTVLVVAAAVTWLLRRALSRGDGGAAPAGTSGFVVVFERGRVASVSGRITRAMLSAFEDIAQHAELTGEVRLRGGALVFSDSIGPADAQRFRNAFFASVHVH